MLCVTTCGVRWTRPLVPTTPSLSLYFAPWSWSPGLGFPKPGPGTEAEESAERAGLTYLRHGYSTLSSSGCPSSLTSTRSRNQPLPPPFPSCRILTRLTFRIVTDSMVNSSAFGGEDSKPSGTVASLGPKHQGWTQASTPAKPELQLLPLQQHSMSSSQQWRSLFSG